MRSASSFTTPGERGAPGEFDTASNSKVLRIVKTAYSTPKPGDDVQVMRRSEEEKAHPHAGRSNTKSNDGDGKGRLSRGEDWLGDIHEDTPQRN